MIPKRAFFLWVGQGELPWLRQLSVETFKKQNPDWQVDLIRVPAKADMLAAQATDIFRYHELYRNGGVYLDTDIVFFRPLSDRLLRGEVALTLDKGPLLIETNPQNDRLPGFTNLAFMGGEPGNHFFQYVYEKALERLESLNEQNIDLKHPDAYQVLGVNLLNRMFYDKTQGDIERETGSTITNVPLDLVLPVRWYETFRIFNGAKFDPPDETIGVHWYGDCVDARRYSQQVTEETYMRRPCYLSKAIEMALS